MKASVKLLPFLLIGLCAGHLQAQDHTPRGALWRALVLPGWGQVYNHDYWKLPLVYGALGTSIGAMVYYQHAYQTYRRAYLYAAYLSEDPHPYASYRSAYESLGSPSASLLRRYRDRLRRNRDLAIMSIGVAYAFSVLDAYVSAQLMDFDVSENLSLHLQPGAPGVHLTLRWHLEHDP